MVREHMKNSLHWENQTKHLKSENEKLKDETELLSQSLKFILTFDSFPVNKHCSGKSEYLTRKISKA